jgi:hypothetical protein
MDRFSIIVPMVDDHQAFESSLATVLSTQPADSEVIVAHDGSYNDPYDLGDEVTFVTTDETKPRLADLLNAAIKSATGTFTAIVRAGVELPVDWHLPVGDAFSDSHVGSVSGALVRCDQPKRLVAGGVDAGFGASRKLIGAGLKLNSRKASCLAPAGPTLWAAIYRTDLLQHIAPLCRRLQPMYLDLDIALAAETLGFESVWLPELVITTSDPDAINQEARTAHGGSAERAKRRHDLGDSIAMRLLTIAGGLAATPLNPGSLPHALGRLLPGNYEADIAFRKRLRQPLSQTTVPFTTVMNSSPSELRRAA